MSKIALTPEEFQAWDRFSAAATAGLLADSHPQHGQYASWEDAAIDAANLADALIEERRKRQRPVIEWTCLAPGDWRGRTPRDRVELFVWDQKPGSWAWKVVDTGPVPGTLDEGWDASDLDEAKRRAEHAYHAHAGEK